LRNALYHSQCGGFADLGAELLRQPVDVIGEDDCFMAGAGDGDIAEARTEQVGMDINTMSLRSCNRNCILEEGSYSRSRLSAASISQCAPYKFARIADVAAKAADEETE